MNHDPAAIERAGFRPLEGARPDMIGIGAVRAIASRANLRIEDVTAFRLLDGSWQAYARPAARSGFHDVAMMGSR